MKKTRDPTTKICRACANGCVELTSTPIRTGLLKSPKFPIMSISDAFFEITGVKINLTDCTDPQICLNCLKKLKRAMAFRFAAQQTDLRLKLGLKELLDCASSSDDEPNPVAVVVEGTPTPKIQNPPTPPSSAPLKEIDWQCEHPNSVPVLYKAIVDSFAESEALFDAISPPDECCSNIGITEEAEEPTLEQITRELTLEPLEPIFGDPLQMFGSASEPSDLIRELDFSNFPLDVHEQVLVDVAMAQEELSHQLDTQLFMEHHEIVPAPAPQIEKTPAIVEKRPASEMKRRQKGRPISKLICDFCKEEFKNRMWILRHMKEKHLTEEPIKCEVLNCGRIFQRRENLENHRQVVHSGVKKVQCDYCGAKYFTKDKLTAHMRVHSDDDKPYHCPNYECNHTFKHSSELTMHLLMEHSEGRPFLCRCGKSFKLESGLGRHVREVHTKRGLKYCPECSKGFIGKKSLQLHIQVVHRNERPYKCAECARSYRFSSHLSRHMKSEHPQAYATLWATNVRRNRGAKTIPGLASIQPPITSSVPPLVKRPLIVPPKQVRAQNVLGGGVTTITLLSVSDIPPLVYCGTNVGVTS